MADEEKKNWLERAWDWRKKNIIEPQYKYLPEWVPKPDEAGREIVDWAKDEDKKGNWKDFGRIFGNYLDWDRRMIGAAPHTLPRAFGFDYEFYNPFKGLGSENYEGWGSEGRDTLLPGLDVKADFEFYNPLKWRTDDAPDTLLPGIDFIPNKSMMGVGGADDLWMGDLYNKNLSLANKDSAASKFLQQYDSEKAFQGYINDSMTEKDNKRIIDEIGKKLDWNTWRQKYKYNDPQDFVNLQTKMYEQKIIDNYLDPYMKGVGEKYKERMLSEFGAYDIQNKGYFKNLGFTEPLEISSRTGEPYLVDKDWVDDLYDDDPKNDQNYPDEFNFGMMDPLYKAIFQREDPFKYDQPEHYEHIAPNIVAGLMTGLGTARTAQNLVSRAPDPVRLGLGTLFPFWSQQGMRFPKNWKMVGGKELGPTTRSLAQVGLLPLISEKHKQKRLYPEE